MYLPSDLDDLVNLVLKLRRAWRRRIDRHDPDAMADHVMIMASLTRLNDKAKQRGSTLSGDEIQAYIDSTLLFQHLRESIYALQTGTAEHFDRLLCLQSEVEAALPRVYASLAMNPRKNVVAI